MEATRRVFSVSELTTDIRRLLEQRIGQVWVTGEITNCRQQSSGHVYFTLKDAGAQISCVLFRGDPVAGRQALHAQVLAFAHPRTGAAMRFEAPLPADLLAALERLRRG